MVINLFLTSCTGQEIDDLGIVIAMGFDIEDGEVVITNEVINPVGITTKSKGGGGGEPTQFVMGRGKTIEEAVINTSLTFDKRLYYQHAYIIILGEEVAKQGIYDYIDTLSRSNEIREDAFLMVAKDAKAYEVMGIHTGISQSSGKYIYEIVNQGMINSKTRPLEVNRFFKYLYTIEEGYTLGIIEKIQKRNIGKDGSSEKLEVLSLEGGSVFKDEKLTGYFTGDEMMGFKFIVDELKSGVIVFEAPESLIQEKNKSSTKNRYSSFQIFRNKTKIDIKLIDGKLHLFIEVKFRGNLKAVQEGIDLKKYDHIKQLEKSIGEKVEYYIGNTLERAQTEFEVDTFGIGRLVHRKYPELWSDIEKDWTEVFKDLEYTINVDASINEVGFTNSPQSIRKSRYE